MRVLVFFLGQCACPRWASSVNPGSRSQHLPLFVSAPALYGAGPVYTRLQFQGVCHD